MATWVVVPCLLSLRDEFNLIAPNRDKASDGFIGDDAHSQSSSDHNPDETGATPSEDADSINEVHAFDCDTDLRVPGLTMARCVDRIAERHRTGADNRLQNIIFNRRIISRSWGWATWHAYSGANPHTQHAHFSARYTTAQENDTRPWGLAELVEDDVSVKDVIDALQSADGKAALRTAVYPEGGYGRAVLGYDPGEDPAKPGVPAWPGVADPWNPGQTIALGTAVGTLLSWVRSHGVTLADLRKAADADRVRDEAELARDTAEAARDAELRAALAGLPAAVRAELGDGGPDAAAAEAAVTRALARLRLSVEPTS